MNPRGSDPIGVVHLLGGSQPGGIESFVLSLAREIDRARFALSVLITAGDGPVAAELRDLGVDVVLLGHQPVSPAEWWRYAKAIRARRGAILHANLGGRGLRTAAKLAGCGPTIVHVHGPPDHLVPLLRTNPSLLHDAVRGMTTGTDRVLACSDAVATMLDSALPGLRSRLEIVYPGVDLSEYAGPSVARDASAVRAGLRIPTNAVVVAFVGRLVPQKGVDHLATIAQAVLDAHGDAHVVVAGDGPMRARLRAVEEGAHGARLHMLGWRRDIPAIVAATDILVVPSEWEPFGIVCLEAMAGARPVAAFAIDGIPEVVIDGETGLLAPPRDAAALAARVNRLIDDHALCARLGRAGRLRVEEHFQARFTARRVEAIYAALASPSRVTT